MRLPRKLLTLAVGVGLLAVLALGVGSVSAESPGVFECEEYTCYDQGTQTTNHVFTTKGASITCTGATFTGELAEESSELVTEAVYTCTYLFGGKSYPVAVNMNGCEYKFHAEGEVSAGVHSGVVDVISKPARNCNTEPITIGLFGSCAITIGAAENEGLGIVTYRNIEEARFGELGAPFAEVEVESAISGITYTEGPSCGKPGTGSEGEYSGSALVKGYEDEAHTEQQGIKVE